MNAPGGVPVAMIVVPGVGDGWPNVIELTGVGSIVEHPMAPLNTQATNRLLAMTLAAPTGPPELQRSGKTTRRRTQPRFIARRTLMPAW